MGKGYETEEKEYLCVLKLEAGELGGNYTTMPNISQEKKGRI